MAALSKHCSVYKILFEAVSVFKRKKVSPFIWNKYWNKCSPNKLSSGVSLPN